MAQSVVISGYYGYDNFGDEAILGILTNHLRDLGTEVTVLSHDASKTSRFYGVQAVNNFNPLMILLAILKSDVLISGGGSLLQDVTSTKSLLYYCFIIALAQLFKKRVIIFAQGIGPLQKESSRKLALNLISKCDLVTVRDLKSQDFLANEGIQSTLVSDPVFSVDLPISEKEGTVGVQLRDFKSMNDEFLFNLARHIVENFADRKIELYVFQNSLDYEICKKFEKMLKTLAPKIKTAIIRNLAQNDVIIKISRLEYMIAMRFHAVLVALKTGVKTLAINYDAKVAKLAYEAFLPILNISPDDNFDIAFEKLLNLDEYELLDFARSQNFEWDVFDEYLS